MFNFNLLIYPLTYLQLVCLSVFRTKLSSCHEGTQIFIFFGYGLGQIFFSLAFDYISPFFVISITHTALYFLTHLLLTKNFGALLPVICVTTGLMYASATASAYRYFVYRNNLSKSTNNDYIYFFNISFITSATLFSKFQDEATILLKTMLPIYLLIALIAFSLFLHRTFYLKESMIKKTTEKGLRIFLSGAMKFLKARKTLVLFFTCFFSDMTVYGWSYIYYYRLAKESGCYFPVHGVITIGLAAVMFAYKSIVRTIGPNHYMYFSKSITVPAFCCLVYTTLFFPQKILLCAICLFLIVVLDNSMTYVLFVKIADTTQKYKTFGTSFVNSATVFCGVLLGSIIVICTKTGIVDLCGTNVNMFATILTLISSLTGLAMYTYYHLVLDKK